MASLARHAPGLALLLAVALPALALQHAVIVGGRTVVSAVAIAIVLGILIRNVWGLPEACRSGVALGVKRLLRVGIALMGAQLSAVQVFQTGGRAVLVVATCILLALVVVRLVSVRMGLSDRLAALLGVGTSICGVSAIVATGPLIAAKEEETSLAVGTITVFGLLAVLVYPLLGRALGLSDVFFGTWAGTAVNDTSQVVATGLIYSARAGEVATVVKLTRNLFMAPVIVALGSWYVARSSRQGARRFSWRSAIPGFVVGFLALATLNSLGVFPSWALRALREVSGVLIVVALAGVGLETNLAAMRRIGLRPLYAGLAAAAFMAVASYTVIRLVGIS
jgi:uncharacterized integral membrane protein (TIGR00698 family)